jgi:hypothetical protein
MKYPKISIIAVSCLLSFSLMAEAGEHGHDHTGQPEWAELFGDASLPTVWLSVAESAKRINAALENDSLDGVTDWAETIDLAAHALIDQVSVGEDGSERRLHAALEHAAQLADEVLDGAQHVELASTERAFKRLYSAVHLIGLRLPKSIAEGTADQPRFAEAGAHEH